MYFAIGWLVGYRASETMAELNGQHNVLWGLFWWFATISLGSFAASKNFGPSYQTAGGVVAALLLFLYAMRRPLNSSFKTMMLSSVSFAASFVFVLSIFYVLVAVGWALVSGKFKNEGWSAMGWQGVVPPLVLVVTSFAVMNLIAFLVAPRPARQAGPAVNDAHSSKHAGSGQGGTRPVDNPDRVEPAQHWWEVLQVDPSCSKAEAEEAAKRMLRDYHPDRRQDLPPELQKASLDITRRILEARDQARARAKMQGG